MGVSPEEDYHINTQAQSVLRQSDFPKAIFELTYCRKCASDMSQHNLITFYYWKRV
jgi:hypothetical protein